MNDAVIEQSFSEAWSIMVRSGKTRGEFLLNEDKPEFGLKRGDRIEIRIVSDEAQLTFGAFDVESGRTIRADVEEREVDVGGHGYVVQLNSYRSLRPGGAPRTPGPQPDIPADVEQCRFSCQALESPACLTNQAPIVQIVLPHGRWNAYHNTAPIEPAGHCLWVPMEYDRNRTVLPHVPQQFTQELLADTLALFHRSRRLIIFYNSLHAGATVNHFHLQAVYHKQQLAIERAETTVRDGIETLNNYLFEGFVFDRYATADEVFPLIERMQDREVPYNLICIGERICLIPRNREHEVVEEFPSGAMASMEFAGKIITSNANFFEQADYSPVATALRRTTLPLRELVSLRDMSQ